MSFISTSGSNGQYSQALAGGSANQIPIQLAPSQTGFLNQTLVSFTTATGVSSATNTGIPVDSFVFISGLPNLTTSNTDDAPVAWLVKPSTGNYQMYVYNNSATTASGTVSIYWK